MANLLLRTTFIAISFLLCGCSAHHKHHNRLAPIQQFVSVVSFFSRAEICNHTSEAIIWVDDFGSVDIRFKTALESGENPAKVCKCIYKFINRNNWLGDVTHRCIEGVNCVTLALIGPPKPGFKLPATTNPIFALSSVLEHFPIISLGGYPCKSYFKVKKDGSTQLVLKCDLQAQPSSVVLCSVTEFLNQNNLLNGTKITSKADDEKLTIKIVGQ